MTPDDAVADAHRREWGPVLAATVRVTRDLDTAEECVQEAYAQALEAWRTDGVPRSPGAWLTTAARRRALDRVRHADVAARALPLLVTDEAAPDDPEPDRTDLLALVFTCCHPALAEPARVALTLRLLGGLTTFQIAKAFLVPEPTMAARITRAKKKIATARVPYRVPGPAELPERLDAVLTVVHLVLTTGHTAPDGEHLVRRDLVDRALDLARLLRARFPDDGAVAGLLALVLLTDARRATRVGADGSLTRLADQDRSRWDAPMIAEGTTLAKEVLLRSGPGRPASRYALLAAIAAVHCEAPTFADTDWAEIVGLYDVLLAGRPDPVVALNRAVAVGFADGPAAGLEALRPLEAEPRLASYHYLAAARAEFLRLLGHDDEAALAGSEALLLAGNAVERTFLQDRDER
ncbi:sigma-70 family RNA polymerase sigma factor [Actinomycetospora endophytica]|uniref:Sigma-70 family RNA polymerase sigma factor n=1 Tax=Actinomycetospora endophytica TaxID=2291215 RepID=A0ABS8PEL9_9PSEU|nr:sigma-70 family RNA polymerase sigma factor [Actinomycetospora endophytica]MCD2196683.1 sigma-70 family RNA polymerase sigma factor [Actinomycetospora endophytica]